METLKFNRNKTTEVYGVLETVRNLLEKNLKNDLELSKNFECKSIIERDKKDIEIIEELAEIFLLSNEIEIVGK